MLDETEGLLDDERHTLIRIVAESVDAKAGGAANCSLACEMPMGEE